MIPATGRVRCINSQIILSTVTIRRMELFVSVMFSVVFLTRYKLQHVLGLFEQGARPTRMQWKSFRGRGHRRAGIRARVCVRVCASVPGFWNPVRRRRKYSERKYQKEWLGGGNAE